MKTPECLVDSLDLPHLSEVLRKKGMDPDLYGRGFDDPANRSLLIGYVYALRKHGCDDAFITSMIQRIYSSAFEEFRAARARFYPQKEERELTVYTLNDVMNLPPI